jgi:DNA invertase Pin-like site-specific DNA recombinase
MLTPEEEREFLERRAHAAIERHEYIVAVRRGRIVYRENGKAGADLPVPPYYWRMLQRQRDFQAEASKVERSLAARWLHKPRQRKAEELAARIRHLAETITSGSRYKLIAREAGCSVATVKRVLGGRK